MTDSEPVAQFSKDRLYRYTLWRSLGGSEKLLPREFTREGYAMFIGLNPSTADEFKDDPTVRKCMGFALRWGYSRMCMANLFAWRDTLPGRMKRHKGNAVGPENDAALVRVAKGASVIVAAWGLHGAFLQRAEAVCKLLQNSECELCCLKRNKDGTPNAPALRSIRHPVGGIPMTQQINPPVRRIAVMRRTLRTSLGFVYKKGSKVIAYRFEDFWVIERLEWVGDKNCRINNSCAGVPRNAFLFLPQ